MDLDDAFNCGSLNLTSRRPLFRDVVLGVAVATLVACGASGAYAVVVTDNFSDANDTASPAWVHLNNAVGSTGQTWDASTGQYRLHASGNSVAGASVGYGFAGSYVEPTFTDVRVTADVLAFPNIGLQGSFFGVAARLNGDNSPPTVTPTATRTNLNGYVYQYEASSAGGTGEMVLNILHGGGLKDIGSQQVTLDNTKDYRFVLDIVGQVLRGQVFELNASGGIVSMVAEKTRDLTTLPAGLGNYDGDSATPDTEFVPFTSGYSGVYVIGHAFYSDGDATFDNFRTDSLGSAGPADFDEDGDVDGDDLARWRMAFGVNAMADADDDGDSDGDDFLVWQRGLAASVPAVAAAPEPATAALVVTALLALTRRPRRASCTNA
jgi:hypothetical protein